MRIFLIKSIAKLTFKVAMLTALMVSMPASAEESPTKKVDIPSNFQKDRLVAWCIVPFDAAKRGPVARADMVVNLGLRRVAYDWRSEHIPTFEQEIQEYQKRGIEFFAFWDWRPEMEPLIRQYEISPQIWKIAPSPEAETYAEKIRIAGEALKPLAEKAISLDCSFGIYNHVGWSGEPENMVAVCQWLRKTLDSDKIGIVYNQHHGHEHIENFEADLQLMKPYLLCLNLNGMNPEPNPKILPVGQGSEDLQMIKTILESGYQGPIGVLDHRLELDSELSLKQNLEGLEKTLKELN